MSATELKEVSVEINGKLNTIYLPLDLQDNLLKVDQALVEMEEILAEGQMEGLSYKSNETEIYEVSGDVGLLNAYIGEMESEALEQLDKPLHKGFTTAATEALSLIKLEEYQTENRLGIKSHEIWYGKDGDKREREKVKGNLTMEDFLGITSIQEGKDGYIVNMPKEFSDFTELFALDYREMVKSGAIKKEVTLEEYLKAVKGLGEFDHEVDLPFQQFVSNVLDVTIIKPLLDACLGYDVVTKEELSDMERGLNVVYAGIDVITLFIGLKGSGILKAGSKQIIKYGGKILALDMLGCGTAYGISQICEKLGLPVAITLLLSGAGGVVVVMQGGKYIFKNSAGEVIHEVSQESLESVVKGASGAGGNKDTIISPQIKEKILWGQRKNPKKNEIIGGHSPEINNNHYNYAVEEIKINPDGTKNIKFTTQFPDGNLAKIKSSTVFPDGWTDKKIVESIQKVGNSDAISIRTRDGATWHRGIVDGVEIDVLKNGNEVISGYPTGTKNALPPSGFKK